MPELGPPLGKGDAMWRALSVAGGELIAYLDSDTRRFSAHFATGMLGPLLLDPGARFVKGTFRRPFATPGRPGAARGRRQGHGADGAAAPVRVLPRAGRLRSAAGGRGGGAARALPPASLRHRIRGRDRDAAGRPRAARRHRGHGRGGPGRAPQPPQAAGRAGADGRRGAAGGGRPPAAGWAAARRRAARSWRARPSPACASPPERWPSAASTRTSTARCSAAARRCSATPRAQFTLLAARALEACHRAGAEVVIKSGRRRAQVMEDARLLGQSAYIFEMGSGLVIDGELTWLTGEWEPGDGDACTPRSPPPARPPCCSRSSRG